MRVRRCLLGVFVCVWLVASLPLALAQTGITFVDVPFDDSFVVTLPDDWRVWAQSDYDDFDAADEAAVALFNDVYDAGLTTPFVNPETHLLATPADAPDGGTVRYSVEMLGLADFAAMVDIPVEDVTADVLADTLGGTVEETVAVNLRPVAFSRTRLSGQPLLTAAVVFAPQDRIAVMTLTAPADYLDAHAALVAWVLSTLRLEGEPLSAVAVVARTGEDALPDDWTLPETVVYAEPTSQPVTCLLNADINVNLRGGPSTAFPVVGSLPAGTTVTAVAQTTGLDGFIWFQTEDAGWARADVIVEAPDCADLPVVAST